jgi:hypothetical protein
MRMVHIRRDWILAGGIGMVLLSLAAAGPRAAGQNVLLGKEKDILFDNTRYARGQNVVPVFEGWVRNPDKTVTMVFGYFNRNWEEELIIPIGPNNNITPGGPDRQQPTYFLPRRNRNIVLVKMPKDYTKGDVIWTLTVNGKIEKAYGSLIREEEITEQAVRTGGSINVDSDDSDNAAEAETVFPPSIKIASVPPTAATETITLHAIVSDNPTPPKERIFANRSPGLRMSWMQLRGPAKARIRTVTTQLAPESGATRVVNGSATATVTVNEPGTYVLRGIVTNRAGVADTADVTVTVNAR